MLLVIAERHLIGKLSSVNSLLLLINGLSPQGLFFCVEKYGKIEVGTGRLNPVCVCVCVSMLCIYVTEY